MRKCKNKGVEAMRRRNGMLFVAPWVFGVIVFFLVPLGTSLMYSLSVTSFSADGISCTFAGFKHYKNMLFENPSYLNLLLASISGIFTSLPIILALSLIIAILLNQKFRGRIFMRAIFFFPVIMASGPVISCMAGADSGGFVTSVNETGTATAAYMNAIDFNDILFKLNLPGQMNTLLTDYLSNTFNLIWSCGIQIILFISGLQMIPEQLYEVGRVEGATAWERFWFITVPSLGQVILLVVIYTMIELFVSEGAIVENAINDMMKKNYFDYTSAELWLYFAVVMVIIGIVIALYNRFALKRWS